jgi:amidophosphoribosyltransferase
MYRATGSTNRNDKQPQFCDACFSGDYPIELTDIDGGRKDAQLSLLAEVA